MRNTQELMQVYKNAGLSGSFVDISKSLLKGKGFDTQISNAFYQWLGSEGYTGQYSERWTQWWEAGFPYLVLGTEVSGDPSFDNAGYWTFIAGPITVAGGNATWVGGASGSHLREDDFDAEAGVEYEVVVDITSITGGSIGARGSTSAPDEGDIYYTTAGVHTRRMTFAAGENFRLRAGAGGTSAVVASWSVKPVIPT